ncbi:ATP-binding protein [Dactylosporangium sp. NPDC049742]|uniref:ATP-binding protein n=1 Tax=Dactylosporangium sp. NPDC049742 TaxID=3154737 RepID=UPI00344AC9B2
MDERAGDFVTAFRAFLEEVVSDHRERQDTEGQLVPVLTDHLGSDPRRLPVVTEELAGHQFVDLDIALDEVQRRGGRHALIGIGGGEQRRHQSLSEILQHAGRYGQFGVAAVDYASVATGPDTARQAVSFGLRLLMYDGAPVAVLQRSPDMRVGQPMARMEVVTAVEGVAARLIEEVGALMLRRSVLRGQVLSLGGSAYERGVGQISFHRRPDVTEADIILPDGVLARVHRHVAGIAEHRDRLRAAGQHLKRGLLLYGPPGTGKTHTVRYLLSALPDVTVVLLAGPAIAFVAEAARMARALQPALVVLEDCDLVAESRELHHGPQPLLFTVLETLDGLGDDADVAFLLTTNRVNVLEPALAQRPGRVDLAVEIPLPDEDSRRRLLRLYARSLPFTEPALDRAAAAAAGVTASFAKELLRRAVLIAAEEGTSPADAHLAAALDEMLSQAESVTRSLLGTPAS